MTFHSCTMAVEYRIHNIYVCIKTLIIIMENDDKIIELVIKIYK